MLVLVGCSHHSAPVAFRERLAVQGDELTTTLRRLLQQPDIEEALILSTCNRVELLARANGGAEAGVATLKEFRCAERGVSSEQLERHVYLHSGLGAARHVMRVATGLDSMILGEPQILGQVKQAYATAKGVEATGPMIDRLMQQCLGAAKRIRTETGISRNAISVASAAVNLARQIFGELRGRRALLIGAGKMTQLVARHLVGHGVTDVAVTSRTYNHAVTLAERFHGRPMHWEEALARLHEVDIVVSCTGAPRAILGRREIVRARRLRRGEPLFLIDIAVPRDIDSEVNELDNVYLYDIDGLQRVVDQNLHERERAAAQAEQKIERELRQFDRWRQSLEVAPTIVALRETLLALGRGEVERFARRLGPLSPEQRQAVDELVRALVQKILHPPVRHLRQSVERGDVDASAALYKRIFGLREPGEAADVPEAEAAHGAEVEDGDDRTRGPQRLLRGGRDE
jgi:glutamyl-tRNA reductase